MGKSQRIKGAAFEREVKSIMSAIFPCAERQGWRQVSDRVPDVQAGPFDIECKIGSRTYPRKALAQASEIALPGHYPIAICKDDRTEPTVTLWLDDFIDIVKEWHERGIS